MSERPNRIPTAGGDAEARRAWVRRLEAASVLPPDDPERHAVEAEVARLGGWAEARWLLLLEEGERWRLELNRGEVPEGLLARLEAIPAAHPAAGAGARRPLLRFGAAAAAVLLVGLGAWLLGSPDPGGPPSEGPALERRLEDLALLVLGDHLGVHTVEHEESDPAALSQWLGTRVGFDVDLPALAAPWRLLGGRKCKLAARVVAFSAWQGPDGRATLIALRAADFGLPDDLAPRTVFPAGEAAGAEATGVRLWSEGGRGYALVAEGAGVPLVTGPR